MNHDFKYYSPGPLPIKPAKPKLDPWVELAEALEAKKEAYFRDMATYEEELRLWRQNDARLQAEFKADCLEYWELLDNPRAERAWAWAYQQGHSEGLEGIYYWLGQAHDLLVGD